MRKDFTLYPITEARSVRQYVHDTGKADQFHAKGVKLLESFLAKISKPAQELLGAFNQYKKAMAESQHLGTKKSGGGDVVETLGNILREIYGTRRFKSLGDRMTNVEQDLQALEALIQDLTTEDVSQSISDLSKSGKQLKRETPAGVVDAGAATPAPRRKPAARPAESPAGAKLPAEGTPEWDRWVAMRAFHIQNQKERAHKRGDTSKGDDLNGHDWWDHKAHWKQAADEIRRYVAAGGDEKFAWGKHYHDWRASIGDALNEYYTLKDNEDAAFFKSIMPPKPKTGYM